MTAFERLKAAFAITIFVLGSLVVVAMLIESVALADWVFSAWGLSVFIVSVLVAPAVVRLLPYRRGKKRDG